MSILIQKTHSLVTSARPSRVAIRKATRAVKNVIGVHDPFGDLMRASSQAGCTGYVDIGSFVGTTIQRILDETSLPVYGYEPDPRSFSRLQTKFKGNKRVTLYQSATGGEPGSVEFNLNKNPQTSSLLGSSGKHHGDDLARSSSSMVDVVPLDHLRDGVIGQNERLIIKADVQGAERELVEGGMKVLSENCAALYSEAQLADVYDGQIDFFELNELLSDCGLVLSATYPSMRDDRMRGLQLDALWVRPSML